MNTLGFKYWLKHSVTVLLLSVTWMDVFAGWEKVGGTISTYGSVATPQISISDGKIYISYIEKAEDGKLICKKLNGSAWSNLGGETLSGFALSNMDRLFKPRMNFYVKNDSAYSFFTLIDAGIRTHPSISVVKYNTSIWSALPLSTEWGRGAEFVHMGPDNPQIIVDKIGQPIISYIGTDNKAEVRYVGERTGKYMNLEKTAFASSIADNPSFSGSNIYVGMVNSINSVSIARKSPVSDAWETFPVPLAASVNASFYIDLSFDIDGSLYVALIFSNTRGKNLKVYKWSASALRAERVVESPVLVTEYNTESDMGFSGSSIASKPNIAVKNGRIHLLFKTSESLGRVQYKYTYFNGSTWVGEHAISSKGNADLTLNNFGQPHIFYNDLTDGNIVIRYNETSSSILPASLPEIIKWKPGILRIMPIEPRPAGSAYIRLIWEHQFKAIKYTILGSNDGVTFKSLKELSVNEKTSNQFQYEDKKGFKFYKVQSLNTDKTTSESELLTNPTFSKNTEVPENLNITPVLKKPTKVKPTKVP